MAVVTASEVHWDPYDVGINADPYPVFRRLREEAPLYRNEEHDFYALSRWDDVEWALKDRDTFLSCRGNVLEIIKAGVEQPPGTLIFEDPPMHTIHRSLLSRAFTPKRMAALEPEIRAFAAECLDPLVGRRRVRLRGRSRRAGPHAGHRDAPRDPRGGSADDPRRGERLPADRAGPADAVLQGILVPDRDAPLGDLRRLHRLAGGSPVGRRDHGAADRGVRGRARRDAVLDPRRGAALRQRRLRCRERDDQPPDRVGRQGARRAPGPAPCARRRPVARAQRGGGTAPVRGARPDHRPVRGSGRRDPRPGRAGGERPPAARPRRQP